jgi:ATP-binding cassette, subfamily B, bacterial HlyB/CyaB
MTVTDPASAGTSVVSPVNASPDSGLYSLALLAAVHHVTCEPNQLRHELGLGVRSASHLDIVRAARGLKLKARALTHQQVERLQKVPLPVILELEGGRFVICGRRLDDGRYRIVDAVTRVANHLTAEQIAETWGGTIILITRRFNLQDAVKGAFGLGWFIPPMLRYKRALLSVLAGSLFIQVCALITPVFFQIIIDKVLVHKGYSTLVLVMVGLIGIGFFHVVLQYLRSYVLSHTASRIDVELGARLFDHLLRLPLEYFETRPAGLTVARVRELETVRSFLTGQGLTSALDLLFTIILIVVLFIYSQLLAIIVCLSIPCYIIVAAVLRPVLRAKTKERFNRGAISNQFLVESVVGIQTIKSLAVEPTLRNQWEERLAAYVRTSFSTVVIASIGQNAIQYINKVTMALVLYFGALAVINNEMTVGALVAFNMIMNQVTAPILRLSQLWQDFQQVRISVDRLGDILNFPPESRPLAQAHLPPAKGEISVRNVSFRYHPGTPEVLREVSIAIPAGQVVGIVGPSGSGKSTFAKLLQRLYSPERGQIMIDGIDIAHVDPAWLRRQIGVVLQENLLFNRTVHENIALANVGMSRPAVMAVARLAGADEFISRLPLGYDTIIEERGSNLSGGQRQRLAIARALAINPRILIFDEATSALDYESERVIRENMQYITRGRTVIIIAHRLAAVRSADRIIAIQEGRIIEDGSHADLLAKSDSMYGRLWRLQSGEEAAA